MATSENAVVDLPDELEDLEVCVKEGRAARCVRRYQIRIDRELYTVHVTYMTGQQLLGELVLSQMLLFLGLSYWSTLRSTPISSAKIAGISLV